MFDRNSSEIPSTTITNGNAQQIPVVNTFNPFDHVGYKSIKFVAGVVYSETGEMIARAGVPGAAIGFRFVPRAFTLVEYIGADKSTKEISYLMVRDYAVDEMISRVGGKILGKFCSVPFSYVTYGLDFLEYIAPYGRAGLEAHEKRFVTMMGGEEFIYNKPKNFNEITASSFVEMQMRRDFWEGQRQGMTAVMIGEAWHDGKELLANTIDKVVDTAKKFSKIFVINLPATLFSSAEAVTIPIQFTFNDQHFDLRQDQSMPIFSINRDSLMPPPHLSWQRANYPVFSAPFAIEYQKILADHGYNPNQEMIFTADGTMQPASSSYLNPIREQPLDANKPENLPGRNSHVPIPAAPRVHNKGVSNPFSNFSISGHYSSPKSWSVVLDYTVPLSAAGGWITLGFTTALVGTIKFLQWRQDKAYDTVARHFEYTKADVNTIVNNLKKGFEQIDQLIAQNDPYAMQLFMDSVSHQIDFIKGKMKYEFKDRKKELSNLSIEKDDKKECKKQYDDLNSNCEIFIEAWKNLKNTLGIYQAYQLDDENQAKQFALSLPDAQRESALQEVDEYFRFKENLAIVAFNIAHNKYTTLLTTVTHELTAIHHDVSTEMKMISEAIDNGKPVDLQTILELKGRHDKLFSELQALEYFPGATKAQQDALEKHKIQAIQLSNKIEFIEALPKLLAKEITLDDCLVLLKQNIPESEYGSSYTEGGFVLLSVRQNEQARQLFQSALAIDPTNPMAKLGLAYTYANDNLLDKALDELRENPEQFQKDIKTLETHLSVQEIMPVANLVALMIHSHLMRKKEWSYSDHMLNSLLFLHNSHPQLFISLAHRLFSNDPFVHEACDKIILSPLEKMLKLELRASAMTLIQLVKAVERAPGFRNNALLGATALIADVLYDGFTVRDLLAVEPYAIAHFAGLSLHWLVRKFVYKNQLPETALSVVMLDLTHTLPRFLGGFFINAASSVKVIQAIASLGSLGRKIFWGGASEEARDNSLRITRNLFFHNEIQQGLNRYHRYPDFRYERDFAHRVLRRESIEQVVKYSHDNEPNTVNSYFAINLIGKMVSSNELQSCPTPLKNQLLAQMEQASLCPISQKKDSSLLRQITLAGFRTSAVVLVGQGFPNTAQQMLKRARNESLVAIKHANVERSASTQFIDWCKNQFKFGKVSSTELTEDHQKLEQLLESFSRHAALFSAGDLQKGFGSHLFKHYYLRQLTHTREEQALYEFEMIIKLSHWFADDITLDAKSAKQKINTATVIEYLITRAADDTFPMLQQVALFLLDKVKSTKRPTFFKLAHVNFEQLEFINKSHHVNNLLNGIDYSYLKYTATPIEVQILEHLFQLAYGNREQSKQVINMLINEFFIVTPTSFTFKYFVDDTEDLKQSMVQIFLYCNLAFYTMIKTIDDAALFPQVERFAQHLLDAMLIRGYLPPFKRMLVKHLNQECQLSIAQIQTLLEQFMFDDPARWSAKQKFDLLIGVLKSNVLKQEHLTLGQLHVTWASLARNALQCSASCTEAMLKVVDKNTLEQNIYSELKTLLLMGADPNHCIDKRVYLLHRAVKNGLYEVVTLLLQYGADVNVYNDEGVTPLHYAAILYQQRKEEKFQTIVKTLLSYDADRNLVTTISAVSSPSWWWNFGNKSAESILQSMPNVGQELNAIAAFSKAKTVAAPLPRQAKRYLLNEHQQALESMAEKVQQGYSPNTVYFLLKEYVVDNTKNELELEVIQDIVKYFENPPETGLIVNSKKMLLTLWDDKYFCVLFVYKHENISQLMLIHTDAELPFSVDRLKILANTNVVIYKKPDKLPEDLVGVWFVEMTKKLLAQPIEQLASIPNEQLNNCRFHVHLPFLQSKMRKQSQPEDDNDDIVEMIIESGSLKTGEAAQETEVETKAEAEQPKISIIALAKKNEIGKIRQALNERADLNERDNLQATALHWACSLGHIDIVEELLDYHAPLEAQHNDGEGCFGDTPLHWAVEGNNNEIVSLLLCAGASPIAANSSKITPIDIAFSNKNQTLLKILLNQALYIACQAGRLEDANNYISKGADVNALDCRKSIDENFVVHTALGAAIVGAHECVVTVLINKEETDVNKKNPNGDTSLILAAKTGNIPVAKLLLTRKKGKADFNVCGSKGRTAIAWAAANGHTDMVEYLLTMQVDLTTTDQNGNTALHLAKDAKHNHCEELINKYLQEKLISAVVRNDPKGVLTALQSGVSPVLIISREHGDYAECSLLFYAVMHDYVDIAFHLLQFGADINERINKESRWWKKRYLTNANNWTLFSFIVYFYNRYPEKLFELALDEGANVNECVVNGSGIAFNLTTYLIDLKQTRLAKQLLEHGANPNSDKIPTRWFGFKTYTTLEEYYADKYNASDELYYWIRGNAFYFQQQYYQAEVNYQRILELNPLNAYTNFCIAKCKRKRNRKVEAISYLDQAIKQNPRVMAFLKYRSNLHFELQNNREALKDIQQLVAVYPRNANYHYYIGIVLHRMHCYEEAVSYFNNAIKLDSKPEYLMNRAYALMRSKHKPLENYKQASDDFAKVCNSEFKADTISEDLMQPAVAQHYAMACYLKGKRQFKEALDELKKAEYFSHEISIKNNNHAKLHEDISKMKNKLIKLVEVLNVQNHSVFKRSNDKSLHSTMAIDKIKRQEAKNLSSSLQDNLKEDKLEGNAKTLGNGDCAFHAALGELNNKNYYECKEIVAQRRKVADSIKYCKKGDVIYPLVKEAIFDMVIGNRGGKNIQAIRREYQDYLKFNKIEVESAWDYFSKMLADERYSEVRGYIDEQSYLPQENTPKAKFHACLDKNEGELYGRIASLPELQQAFNQYKENAKKDFDLDDYLLKDREAIEEYANYIGTIGNWLLPVELKMIAHTFDITIEFFTTSASHQESRLIETYNPGQSKTVAIRFNGINHFERHNPVETIQDESKMQKTITM